MSRVRHAERGMGLNDFALEHALWDPMPLWDGQRYLMYVLAMDRDRAMELGSFFTRENAIHVFSSTDSVSWEYLGEAISPRNPEERLCAGNVLLHEGRYWFFGSATVDQFDEDHLDQRLFLAVSDDGLHFEHVPDFRLEPDPEVCPHGRFHPVEGRMLFAWRDPWPLYDPATATFVVFVCTGGERWGCPPEVVMATSDTLAGPYVLHGSVLQLSDQKGAARASAFQEIERVNVFAAPDGFLLTFSCWRRLVDSALLSRNCEVDEPLTDFTT